MKSIKAEIIDYIQDQQDYVHQCIKDRFIECDIKMPENYLQQKFNPFAEEGLIEDGDLHDQDLAIYHYLEIIIHDLKKMKPHPRRIRIDVRGGIAYVDEKTVPENVEIELNDYDNRPPTKEIITHDR